MNIMVYAKPIREDTDDTELYSLNAHYLSIYIQP